MTTPLGADRIVMARVLNYRFFNSDITPTALYYDLYKACGFRWEQSAIARWNRKLQGPVPGYAICYGCKEQLTNWAARGLLDTCSYCSHHFTAMSPGPQAMLLSAGHDVRLQLYTFSWDDQAIIFQLARQHKKVYQDHGILPQSYQQRISQEDVKPARYLVLNAQDSSQLPAEI